MPTTTYVEYLLPGSFFPGEGTRRVPDRSPQREADNAPSGAFAFAYHDIVTATVAVGGEQVPTESAPRNRSGRYYLDAQEMTAADVEAMPGDHRILLDNMRLNRWETVWRCPAGNFQPKQDGDMVLTTGRQVKA